MIWTINKPTQPGWYWYRYCYNQKRRFDILPITQAVLDRGVPWNGEWSSTPIAMPEETV